MAPQGQLPFVSEVAQYTGGPARGLLHPTSPSPKLLYSPVSDPTSNGHMTYALRTGGSKAG